MTSPSNPNKIVLINNYYPKGLTTKQIYDYYISNKNKILYECSNRPILLFMKFSPKDRTIVKRNIKGKKIVLTNKNYEEILSGYTVSISVETPDPTPYWIIDVDSKRNQPEKDKKEAVNKLISFLRKNISIVENHRITNTATGYHVFIKTRHKQKLSEAKRVLYNLLVSEFQNEYDIDPFRPSNKISFDLSTMNKRGAHIVPFALTRNGLICKDVTRFIDTYNRKDSIL